MALEDQPNNFSIGRRAFLGGSAAAGALSALRTMGVHSMAFAQDDDGADAVDVETSSKVQVKRLDNVVITVFLRGGADFLNMIVPSGDDDRRLYEQARPEIQVPRAELLDIDPIPFGFHPAAAGLHQLFDDETLAIVQGAGLTADTRSHFDAMAFIERGTTGNSGPGSGWLARHLATSSGDDGLIPALAMGGVTPTAYLTSNEVFTLARLNGFAFPSQFNPWVGAQRGTLRRLYSAQQTKLHEAGIKALDGSNVIELKASEGEYVPRRGVEYPGSQFSQQLQSIAQVIKADLGLHTATIDLGGWDTHGSQGNGSGGTFSNLVGTLSDGLTAFVADLDEGPGARSFLERTTVVVMSEFGRRVAENAAAGTDHGHGGNMLVIGGEVNGGVYGTFPGLEVDQRYDSADVAVTTDYRQVMSEIVIRRMGNPQLGAIFPDYDTYSPLGLVTGEDLEPDFRTLDPSGPGADADASGAQGERQDAADADGEDQANPEAATSSSTDSGSGVDLIPVAGLGTGAAVVAGVAAVAARRNRAKQRARPGPIEPRLYDETGKPAAPNATGEVVDLRAEEAQDRPMSDT